MANRKFLFSIAEGYPLHVRVLLSYAGKFDMYVEDECAAYVRYCFKDPMDAAIFRSRFERKSDPFRRAG
jgi:hypothetical protein